MRGIRTARQAPPALAKASADKPKGNGIGQWLLSYVMREAVGRMV